MSFGSSDPVQKQIQESLQSGSFSQSTFGAGQILYPPYVLPAALDYLKYAQGLTFPGGKPAQAPLPYQAVAPFTIPQISGMSAITAMGPFSPLVSAAQEQNLATTLGAYLTPESNPFLQSYFEAAARPMVEQYQFATAPDIMSQAARSGNLMSSDLVQRYQLAGYDLQRNLADLAAKIYEPAYQYERGLQQQAILQGAPTLTEAQYIAPYRMIDVGRQMQEQMQNILSTGYQNLLAQGMWPYQALDILGKSLGVAAGPGLQEFRAGEASGDFTSEALARAIGKTSGMGSFK